MKAPSLIACVALLAVPSLGQSLPDRVRHGSVSTAPDGRAREPQAHLSFSDDRFSRLHFDRDAGGATWVRGRRFKARFDAAGAAVYPFMGSDAPRLYPLSMSLESARVGEVEVELSAPLGANREGDVVSIDRGAVVEVYELSVDAIEQKFVIRALPASGEIVLRVRMETELTASEREDAIVFANERGSIQYGHAAVLTERNGTIGLDTRYVEGAVEIRIPPHVVARVGLPLVVDPIITAFTVHQNQDQFAPDVAFDAASNVYLVVEQEKFASVDDDVYTTRITSTGVNAGGAYADISTADWQSPRVANLNAYDQFLVVASIKDPAVSFGQWHIGGRHTSASDLSYGAAIQISPGGVFADMVNPDVGGDPYASAPAYYCVTWEWQSASLPQTRQIVYRMVTNAAPVGANETALTPADTTWGIEPSISNGNGGSTWTIGWRKYFPASGVSHVFAARVDWAGSLTNGAFPLDTSSSSMRDVSVASPFDSGECAVAYFYYYSHPTWGTLPSVAVRVLTGASVGPLQDISALENYYWNLRNPSADCDGSTLLVASETDFPVQTEDVQYGSYSLTNGVLSLNESGYSATTGFSAWRPSVCAAHSTGGPSHYFLEVNDQVHAGGRSIRGKLYAWPGGSLLEYCPGDGTGTACPCANSGFAGHGCQNSASPAGGLLEGTGNALMSFDTLVLRVSSIPNGGCLYFQGTASNNFGAGAPFGDGLLCVGGSIVRVGVVIASMGIASFPAAGGTPVSVLGGLGASGGDRYYQGWYRDNASYCTSSVYNLTNGLRVTWAP